LEPGPQRWGEAADEGGCGEVSWPNLGHFSLGKSALNWSLAHGGRLRRWMRAAAGGQTDDFWAIFWGGKVEQIGALLREVGRDGG